MTERKINTRQAKEFAYCFAGEISAYIANHLKEYQAYLIKTGQTDTYYQNINSEAEAADNGK